MKVRLASWLGACALAWFGSFGCDVEDLEPRRVELEEVQAVLAQELCGRMFSCRCEQGTRYDDTAECESEAAQVAQNLALLPQQYPGADLVYDPTCMGTLVDQIADLGCNPEIPFPDEDECQAPCHYFHGDARVGEPCQIHGNGVSDCAQGLRCSGSTCSDPCGLYDAPGGEAQLGESCLDRACADGLYCDDVGSTCLRLPEAGQACSFGRCAEGNICSFDDDTCLALPRVGETCVQGECADGLFCDAVDPTDPMSEQQCFTPRALDAACRGHRQCDSGYCPAGFCAVVPRRGESCAGAGICETGLDCVEGVCDVADAAVCRASMPYVQGV